MEKKVRKMLWQKELKAVPDIYSDGFVVTTQGFLCANTCGHTNEDDTRCYWLPDLEDLINLEIAIKNTRKIISRPIILFEIEHQDQIEEAANKARRKAERANMPETTWGRIPKQGYVYLAMCGHTGLIKIGYTTDLKGRERTLKMSNPLIDFFDTHEATVQDEKALHLHFAERKVAGEWFNLEVNDYLEIEEYFKSRNNG